MTAWQTRSMGHDDVAVTIYTYEEAPLSIFGVRRQQRAAGRPRAGGRATAHRTRSSPRATSGLIVEPDGVPLDAQRIVGLPRAVGPHLPGRPDRRARLRPVRPARPGPRARPPCGRRATRSPSRSSRAGSPRSRPTPRPSRSPRAPEPTSSPQPFKPVLRGMLLTGRGQAWMRGPDDAGEGAVERRALFWPPTKIAGRYVSPYLAARDEASGAEAKRRSRAASRSTSTSSASRPWWRTQCGAGATTDRPRRRSRLVEQRPGPMSRCSRGAMLTCPHSVSAHAGRPLDRTTVRSAVALHRVVDITLIIER